MRSLNLKYASFPFSFDSDALRICLSSCFTESESTLSLAASKSIESLVGSFRLIILSCLVSILFSSSSAISTSLAYSSGSIKDFCFSLYVPAIVSVSLRNLFCFSGLNSKDIGGLKLSSSMLLGTEPKVALFWLV